MPQWKKERAEIEMGIYVVDSLELVIELVQGTKLPLRLNFGLTFSVQPH